MIVYLSGPMTGLPDFNFPAFLNAAEKLRAAGHEVLSPAEHGLETGMVMVGYQSATRWMKCDYKGTGSRCGLFPHRYRTTDRFDIEEVLQWDLDSIRRSEAVVVIGDPEGSKGCDVELSYARAIGRPIHQLDEFLSPQTDKEWADRLADALDDMVVESATDGCPDAGPTGAAKSLLLRYRTR